MHRIFLFCFVTHIIKALYFDTPCCANYVLCMKVYESPGKNVIQTESEFNSINSLLFLKSEIHKVDSPDDIEKLTYTINYIIQTLARLLGF